MICQKGQSQLQAGIFELTDQPNMVANRFMDQIHAFPWWEELVEDHVEDPAVLLALLELTLTSLHATSWMLRANDIL